ncbi:hypothetical protein SRHO_G00208570 [Serrasalmus rhombeus]
MARKRELSSETRQSILVLRNEGYSMREIAKKLKISYNGVYYSLQRTAQTGSNQSRKRSGRPRCTTKQEDKHIRVSSLRNRRLTGPQLASSLNSTRKTPVSTSTVKRRLRDFGLQGRVAKKKPYLRLANKRKRLRWAKEHRHWTEEDWKKVLWTDESKFEVFGSQRRTFVRRRTNEKMLKECLTPSVKHGGGNVMVWGCFGAGKVGDLYRVKGILNKEGYHSILQRHAIPSGQRLIGANFILQQDNDPKHTSKLCKNYLQQKQAAGILSVMEWPAQSPDLNPIELLWEQLDRMVRQKCPSNQSNLWELLLEAWGAISPAYLNKLTARMPKRSLCHSWSCADEQPGRLWAAIVFTTSSLCLYHRPSKTTCSTSDGLTAPDPKLPTAPVTSKHDRRAVRQQRGSLRSVAATSRPLC